MRPFVPKNEITTRLLPGYSCLFLSSCSFATASRHAIIPLLPRSASMPLSPLEVGTPLFFCCCQLARRYFSSIAVSRHAVNPLSPLPVGTPLYPSRRCHFYLRPPGPRLTLFWGNSLPARSWDRLLTMPDPPSFTHTSPAPCLGSQLPGSVLSM